MTAPEDDQPARLSYVECEGYRAFREPTRLELGRLTVVFGRNNSGKTTLARLPVFAAASMTAEGDPYALEFRSLRFGSSFGELASADQPHPRVAGQESQSRRRP